MMLCVKLCKIQQEETYATEYLDYQKSEHSFNPIEIDGQRYYEMDSRIIEDSFDSYFSKYPRQYNKAVSGKINRFNLGHEYRKEKEMIAMEIALENQERSRRILFKIMGDNIDKWWS